MATKISFPFVLLVGLFVAGLVVSNIIAVKLIMLGSIILPAAVIVFPITYIIGDVLTEVYGYRVARNVIWAGFAGNLLAALAAYLGGLLPPAPFWKGQEAYWQILGFTPRLLVASLIAYVMGQLSNSLTLIMLKHITKGKWMMPRFWASTVVGEAIDTSVFLMLAFTGVIPIGTLLTMIPIHASAKIAYEFAVSPISTAIARLLKRVEGLDVIDAPSFLLRTQIG